MPDKINYMKHISIITLIIIVSSCSPKTSTWIEPPYTNVEKIATIKPGMNLDDVTEALGIPPYNIFHMQEDGSLILLFNYRIKNRRMEIPLSPEMQERTKHSESGQKSGDDYYQSESNYLYVYFKDKKVKSYITESGIDNSEFLMLVNNNLKRLSKGDMSNLQVEKVGNYYTVNSGDSTSVYIVNTANLQKTNPQTTISDSSNKKPANDRRAALYCFSIGVLLSLLLFAVM